MGTGKKLIEKYNRKIKSGMTEEYVVKLLRYDEIKELIRTTEAQIQYAIDAYKKRKLGAKNKQQVEDLSVFDDLKDYAKRSEIQNAYGWEVISMEEMYRLENLWDMREELEERKKRSGGYFDEVVRELEKAKLSIQCNYIEEIIVLENIIKEIESDIPKW